MIFDNIANMENYSEQKNIYRALQFLSTITADNFPTERVVIDGDNIFANPVSLISRPIEDCIFEAHKKYIDIHYIVTGIEGISTRNTSDLVSTGEFNETNDIGFYSGKESGSYYLQPKDFMVCWPEDAHRVAMMAEAPAPITKIVVKVRVQKEQFSTLL